MMHACEVHATPFCMRARGLRSHYLHHYKQMFKPLSRCNSIISTHFSSRSEIISDNETLIITFFLFYFTARRNKTDILCSFPVSKLSAAHNSKIDRYKHCWQQSSSTRQALKTKELQLLCCFPDAHPSVL